MPAERDLRGGHTAALAATELEGRCWLSHGRGLYKDFGIPADPAAAASLQLTLRRLVEPEPASPVAPKTVAGLDVSYAVGTDRLVAAAVVLDVATLAVLDQATADGAAAFPYVPGLLGFREVPFLLAALERLQVVPEVLVCDGYGVAHPRRFGLACHVGVATGLPTFGVAKTPFTTAFSLPGPARGDWSDLRDGAEVLGRVLRTQPGVKPVFVSVGHRIGLAEACSLTLALTPRFRIPETTRLADQLSRATVRAIESAIDGGHRRSGAEGAG